MARLTVLVFITTASILSAQQSWHDQLPRPTRNDLLSVAFADSTHVIAVGDNGTIVRSSDAGLTWSAQLEVLNPLRGVAFSSSTNGVAVGDSGIILHTTDAGIHWSVEISSVTTNLSAIVFADASKGIIIGDGGKILHTTNGGETWLQDSSGTQSKLNGITFVNAKIGFVAGNGIIGRTTDAGASWRWQSYYAETWLGEGLHAIAFVDSLTGFIGDEAHEIVKTTDGGVSWNIVDTVASFDNAVYRSAISYGLAVAIVVSDSNIATTTDNGATWNHYFTVTEGIACSHWKQLTIIAGHRGTILRTTDLIRWQSVSLFNYGGYTPNGMDFASGTSGVLVGGGGQFEVYDPRAQTAGVICRTRDAGQSFAILDSGRHGGLNAVKFFNAATGFAVGDSGTILATTDSGTTWISDSSGTEFDLFGVAFANAHTIYAIGSIIYAYSNATVDVILRTTDSGTHWKNIYQKAGACNGIYCVDDSTVFVPGERTMLSTNGGKDWRSPNVTLTNVCFVNRKLGYGFSDSLNGPFHLTTNGGATWNVVPCDMQSFGYNRLFPFTAISFVDSLNGILLGGANKTNGQGMLQTSDGGSHWVAHLCGNNFDGISSHSWNAVAFPSRDTAYVLGRGFLRYTSAAAAVPHFNCVPNTIDFGAVHLGTARRDSVLVVNTGNVPLIVRNIFTDNPMFSVFVRNRVIAAGTSEMFYVTFTPKNITLQTAHIVFWHDASPLPDSVTLSARGFGGPVFRVDSTRVSALSAGSTEYVSFNMPNTLVGATASETLVVHNDGDASLQITSAYLRPVPNTYFPLDSSFAFPVQEATIAQGDSSSFPIVWKPGYLHSGAVFLVFEHNGFASPDSLLVIGHPYASLLPTPSLLDFDTVAIGETKTDSFYLHNIFPHDTVYLEYTNYSDQAHFSGWLPSREIQPLDSVLMRVSFAPDSAKRRSTVVTFSVSIGKSYSGDYYDTVFASGRGVGAALAMTYPNPYQNGYVQFYTVPAGETRVDTLVIANIGDRTAIIDRIEIQGDSAFQFFPPTFSLSPGDSLHAQVLFAPSASNMKYAATVTLHGNMYGVEEFGIGGNSNANGIHEKIVNPTRYDVLVNYPNPFSTSTTITFVVAKPSHCVLQVYDMLGRTVIGPIEKNISSGTGTIVLDNLNLPNGAYTCELRNGIERTTRMIVVRR